MGAYEKLFRPLLFRMDAEDAHHLMISLADSAVVQQLAAAMKRQFCYEDELLRTKIGNTFMRNPVGLAAGFDKNAQVVPLLASLGFGFAEIGSITAQPSMGNPKPRLFRLPADEGVINRLGLNGMGAQRVADRLQEAPAPLPIGVNIAKTNDAKIEGDKAIEDQIASFMAIRALPLAYVTFNTSCPNTHEGCLQAKDELAAVLGGMQSANENCLPLFIKLSPDSTDELLDDFIGVAAEHNVAGFVCGNTSVTRGGLTTDAKTVEGIGRGGLSGRPIKSLALTLCRRVAARKRPEQQIIGCGGISSGADAFEFLQAGCCAVQLYTGLIYHGPELIARINRELAAILRQRNLSVANASGNELNQISSPASP
ncbi:MAG TPA: quinone-dependent dihydroorotate dehydrogenase [Trichormus sp.]